MYKGQQFICNIYTVWNFIDEIVVRLLDIWGLSKAETEF